MNIGEGGHRYLIGDIGGQGEPRREAGGRTQEREKETLPRQKTLPFHAQQVTKKLNKPRRPEGHLRRGRPARERATIEKPRQFSNQRSAQIEA